MKVIYDNVSGIRCKDGWTALHRAAEENYTWLALSLIQAGADANIQTKVQFIIPNILSYRH